MAKRTVDFYIGKTKKFLFVLGGLFVVFVFLFPIVWTLPFSVKSGQEVFKMAEVGGTIQWLPTIWKWENFNKVFEININGGKFLTSFGVTFLVAACNCVGSILINMLAAYGFARFEFKFKGIIWTYLLMFMFIPGIAIQLTSIRVVTSLGMINTIWVLFVPGLANSYSIFFFRQYFLNIPDCIEEAAMIDGANRIRILWSIFVPLSVTPMIIIGTGAFLGSWNSYIWPTLVITDNEEILSQISQVLYMLKRTQIYNYGVVIAACLITLIVPLTLFFIFQKKLVEGIAISGLK